MDVRTMQYFLAVVREGTISQAAQSLHVAQPSLSRQMKDLERELGATLFERGNRHITLTEEGKVLRRRAQEMVRLMQITEEEVAQVKGSVSGSVRIGAGESLSFRHLVQAARHLNRTFPGIRFDIISGDTQDLMNQLDDGLVDVALIFTEVDHTRYHAVQLPAEDSFGVLMPKDCELARKDTVSFHDLAGCPIIVSRAALPLFSSLEGFPHGEIVATYNLVYNASLLVEAGLGVAICFEGLVNTTGESPLAMRPLTPAVFNAGSLIWKAYEALSPAASLFVETLENHLAQVGKPAE